MGYDPEATYYCCRCAAVLVHAGTWTSFHGLFYRFVCNNEDCAKGDRVWEDDQDTFERLREKTKIKHILHA